MGWVTGISSFGNVGELVATLSLANAPGSALCYTSHLCAPCLHAGLDACRHMPEEVPWPCCQPGLSSQTAAALAWLAGGINPRGEITIGNSRDCHGLPVPSALRFPQHLSRLQQRFCLQWEAPSRAARLAWGQLSSAVPCAVPARVPARWLAALPGHGPELALEGPGCADVWELILGPGLS